MEYFKINSYYEGLLQNLFGGSRGCFSSFMQFFYQFNRARVLNQALSPCFEEICLLELENCKILSEIILKMRGDNKFYSSNKKFLTASSVDYSKNFKNIFLADIELLEFSIIEVKSVISKIDVLRIKNLLNHVLENKKEELKKLKENYFKIGIIE